MIVATIAVVLVAAPAGASDLPLFPNIGPALLLRLEGTLAPDWSTAKRSGFTGTSLEVLGRSPDGIRYLGVDDARTVGGDQPVDGKDVLEAVSPFSPNFLVAGDAKLVEVLVGLPVGSRVRLEGLVDRGSRTLLLRSIERIGDAPPG